MISSFKQLLVIYFISFTIFWTNGSNNDEYSCKDAETKYLDLNTIADKLESELIMFLENEPKRKSPPDIFEVQFGDDSLPSNCYEVFECQNRLYPIMIPNFNGSSFPVSCDFKTEDEAWTVIQRRQDGSVNFHRNWTEYVNGFGDADGEFFIGLEKLHALTTMGAEQQLYIMLEDFEGVRKYAKYNTFRVASKAKDYELTVDGYSGDAGDSLSYHNGYKFYTWDRDNEDNCSKRKLGGWWYNDCFECNLNGKYLFGKLGDSGDGVAWSGFRGYRYSLRFTQMMITHHKPTDDNKN